MAEPLTVYFRIGQRWRPERTRCESLDEARVLARSVYRRFFYVTRWAIVEGEGRAPLTDHQLSRRRVIDRSK